MRAIAYFVGLAAIVFVVLVSFGVVEVDQTQEARLPDVTVSGGQFPKFDVTLNDVDIRREEKTVKVPKVAMEEERVSVPTFDVDSSRE